MQDRTIEIFGEMNDDERDLWAEKFYSFPDAPQDQDSPLPWGCPWLYDELEPLVTPREFLDDRLEEIKALALEEV